MRPSTSHIILLSASLSASCNNDLEFIGGPEVSPPAHCEDTESNLCTAPFPFHILSADFNDDNFDDIVAWRGNEQIDLLTTIGAPTSRRLLLSSSEYFDPSTQLLKCDFNADGSMDFLYTQNGMTLSTVFIQTQTDMTPIDLSSPVYLADNLRCGDWDNDGVPDLVGVRGKSVHIQHGLGNGAFGIKSQLFDFVVQPQSTVELGDFNSDTRLDLLVAPPDQTSVSIAFRQGEDLVGPAQKIVHSLAHISKTFTGSFDADSLPDLILLGSTCTPPSCSTGRISLLMGTDDATTPFAAEEVVDLDVIPNDGVTIDMGTEGWALLVGEFPTSEIYVITPTDNGHQLSSIDMAEITTSIAVGRFNNADLIQLAASHPEIDSIGIYSLPQFDR